MILRIDVDATPTEPGRYDYQVSDEGELLFGDGGFSSVAHCLVAAVEGLSPGVVAIEVACGGFVSGTYPLTVLAMNHEQVAAHALNTMLAVREALANGG